MSKPMNPLAKPFVPPPLNPEEDSQKQYPGRNIQKAQHQFERAVSAANAEKKADEELEAFLEWANTQKTKTRGGARRTRRGTGCVSRKKRRSSSKNKRS